MCLFGWFTDVPSTKQVLYFFLGRRYLFWKHRLFANDNLVAIHNLLDFHLVLLIVVIFQNLGALWALRLSALQILISVWLWQLDTAECFIASFEHIYACLFGGVQRVKVQRAPIPAQTALKGCNQVQFVGLLHWLHCFQRVLKDSFSLANAHWTLLLIFNILAETHDNQN